MSGKLVAGIDSAGNKAPITIAPNGGIRLGVVKAQMTRLCSIAIRDTKAKYPVTNWDISEEAEIALLITNTHDQDITLIFHLQDYGGLTKADGTAMAFVVPSNTKMMYVTGNEIPILSHPFGAEVAIQTNATIAPLVGVLNIYAHTIKRT